MCWLEGLGTSNGVGYLCKIEGSWISICTEPFWKMICSKLSNIMIWRKAKSSFSMTTTQNTVNLFQSSLIFLTPIPGFFFFSPAFNPALMRTFVTVLRSTVMLCLSFKVLVSNLTDFDAPEMISLAQNFSSRFDNFFFGQLFDFSGIFFSTAILWTVDFPTQKRREVWGQTSSTLFHWSLEMSEKIKSIQFKSIQFKSNQIKPNQTKSHQIKSHQIKSNHFISYHFHISIYTPSFSLPRAGKCTHFKYNI